MQRKANEMTKKMDKIQWTTEIKVHKELRKITKNRYKKEFNTALICF